MSPRMLPCRADGAVDKQNKQLQSMRKSLEQV